MPETSLKVFFTAPNINSDATGEAFVAWRWAEALSHEVDLTVFAFQIAGRTPLGETLPKAEVLTAPMPRMFSRFPRFQAMAKPHYPQYMRAVRKVLASRAASFDVAHQIMPQAARYPTPLRGHGIPYIIGPLGGALTTPDAFQSEGSSAAWYTRARALDQWRFRHDPWLRRSYKEAAMILGVAPYMEKVLHDIPMKRFEPVLELGIADLPPLPERTGRKDTLRLLHVGRGVRTKGLRDVIRAMGHLKDRVPGLNLVSAGTGEEIEICREEARRLDILDQVDFRGLIPRDQVEQLYAEADIFVFPSYREPAGNVIYEAMRWGLPVIVAARGGPDWIVDDESGHRIDVTNPDQYSRDIASAIEDLANAPDKRNAMGQAARERLTREGLWPLKAAGLAALYTEVLRDQQTKPGPAPQ